MNRRIFVNGKIHTMDPERRVCEAVYMEDGVIRRMGSTLELGGLDGALFDLGGRTVIPGFHDSHLHLLSYGMALESLGGKDCTSKEAVLEAGRARVSAEKPSALWLGGFVSIYQFTCEDLDSISCDIPVFYTRVNGHTYTPKANIMSKICCNTPALSAAGITADTRVPSGSILVGACGLTGILKGMAVDLVAGLLPWPNREERKRALATATRRLAAQGFTSVHSNDLENGDTELLDILRELDEEGALAVRVSLQCLFERPDELRRFLEPDPRPAFNRGRRGIAALKLILDGSLGDHTAAVTEPYRDAPDTCGILLFSDEALEAMVALAHTHDLPVVMHAIGTRAIRQAINALAVVEQKYGRKNLAHGLIHCLLTEPESFRAMAEVGAAALIQPVSVADDYGILLDRVGPEAAASAYSWKSMLESGLLLAGGTDCPCDSPNPFEALYCAVTREDLGGQPRGGFLPDQKLTLDEALMIMTVNGARLARQEDVRGSLETGKYADFVVLSQDIFSGGPEALKCTKSLATVSEGSVVCCEAELLGWAHRGNLV